jgi:hypothetical protein
VARREKQTNIDSIIGGAIVCRLTRKTLKATQTISFVPENNMADPDSGSETLDCTEHN